MSPATRDRIEHLSIRIDYAVIASIVLCLLIPVIAQLVAAFVRGLTTGRWLEGQGLYTEGDFTLWDTQLWLAWVPVVLLAAWVIVTLPVPLRRPGVAGRFNQLITAVGVLVATVPRVVGGLASPDIPNWGTESIFVVILAIGGLIIARILLGRLRLVPRSWRVYLDENGNVVKPTPMGRARRRNPLADIPQ